MPNKGWKRTFDDPIPRGRQLVTLEDAGKYITKLPKAEHATAEWQAAMQALILVAESGGPPGMLRVASVRATASVQCLRSLAFLTSKSSFGYHSNRIAPS
jgi:hypothetical protein